MKVHPMTITHDYVSQVRMKQKKITREKTSEPKKIIQEMAFFSAVMQSMNAIHLLITELRNLEISHYYLYAHNELNRTKVSSIECLCKEQHRQQQIKP